MWHLLLGIVVLTWYDSWILGHKLISSNIPSARRHSQGLRSITLSVLPPWPTEGRSGKAQLGRQPGGEQLGEVGALDVGELVELGAAGEPVGQHDRLGGRADGGEQGGLGHGC